MKHSVKALVLVSLLLGLLLLLTVPVVAQDADPAPAEIVNDEGGPVVITGEVAYSDPFFTAGVAEPIIILEDQTGFITRNRGFDMPEASQTIGQITSDFFTSPFTYSLALPIEPRGTYNDVDNDDEAEAGVQVFAVAYWSNTWGAPFLEERDLFGGGWSGAYASTRVSSNPTIGEVGYEYIGGTILVYAPDDTQGFPSGFGEDGFLFTDDDPIVLLPAGYTIVNIESDPFTFSREREATIDLIEGEGTEAADFSELGYADAFDAMLEYMRPRYAFTELKNVDWDALSAEFRPRFEEAEANADADAYFLALRDFIWAIPDGHHGGANSESLNNLFLAETGGGIGIAIRDVDDGRVIVNYVLEGGPADVAGIALRAEILEINGTPIDDYVDSMVPWSSPFSTAHVERLQQLRYATRFLVDSEVEVTYQNPGDSEPSTAALTAIAERDSFTVSSFNVGLEGDELPVEFHLDDSGYVYARIYSFFDNSLLSIQVWERMMQFLNANAVPGLIIDMRQNGGGSGWLADQMAAYFFNEPLELSTSGVYNEDVGEFVFDENLTQTFVLPAENLRYSGPVAVLVGPNCNSACEFFSYNLTLQERAAIVGQYPTGGLGGGQEAFYMPEGQVLQFSIARPVDDEGNVIIEGVGVVPTVQVPVDEDTLFSQGDPVLEAAIAHLDEMTALEVIDAGEIAIGDGLQGELTEGQRARYTLTITEDVMLDFTVTDSTGTLDTVLRIYVPNVDDPVLENDDIEAGVQVNSALLRQSVPAGLTIILEVATFNDALAGAYTLSVTESAPIEMFVTEAGEIAVGDSLSGELAVGERARYVLTLEEAAVLTIALSDEAVELDTYLRVYADDETIVAENDDIEPGVIINSLIEALELEAGTYIIEVGTYDDASEGAYTLTVTASE